MAPRHGRRVLVLVIVAALLAGAAGVLSKSLSRAETRVHLAELLERPMPGGQKTPADRGREGVS